MPEFVENDLCVLGGSAINPMLGLMRRPGGAGLHGGVGSGFPRSMPETAAPFIRIRGLTQRFGSNRGARGIDLDVFHGETLAILGGSGCGKSVLIKHLPGLLRPTGGSITVDGVEITGLRERQLGPIRKQMGVLFQGGALFDSLTVAGNVAFPLRESGLKDEKEIAKRVAEALEIVHLSGEQESFRRSLRRDAQARRARPRHRPQAEVRAFRRAAHRSRSDQCRRH